MRRGSVSSSLTTTRDLSVPITSLRVKNFKCFLDSGTLKLAPLTVIFGRNNAGKSTLLQSLLLLRQTLDSPEYESRLNLRGQLFSAGTYADLVHEHRSSLDVSIILGVTPTGGRSTEVELEYSSDEPRSPRLAKLTVQSEDNLPPLVIQRGRGQGGPYELHIDGERVGLESEANFSFPVHGLMPLIGDEPSKVGRPNERRSRVRASARHVLSYLEKQLTDLRALGAFRTPPLRRYEYGGHVRSSIDTEGRNVVDALIDDISGRRKARGQLVREVNRWLKTVGDVQLLPIRRLSPTARLYELRLKHLRSGRWANFADVGSGIGQAFPVIVEGLRTPPHGIFLVQEPEIHLHPDAQLAMGDFILALAETDRRVIAETHSENILLRIRRRVVEARNSSRRLTPEDVSILYVDLDGEGNSIVTPLEMDELGQISEWPRGFMEDATEERMVLMKAMASTSK